MDLNRVMFETVQQGSYDLSYTCLLVPRPSIRLENEFSTLLEEWLWAVCVEHAWRVEFATVDPDYFQWGLRVAPSMQTGQFMKEIRSRTSEMALARFENLRRNEVDEFWAPGYLVVLGMRPHPKEMVEQYIRLSRRQQGVSQA